ncbi:MAG: GAF domain-containing protein [Akkermansiaceae bacterium]|nr:GAF domain-containing protein [Akkermansiaceae bacterium]
METTSGGSSGIFPDPALAELGSAVESAVENRARHLTVEDFQELFDGVTREAVALATAKIGANSTTVWVASEDRGTLTVVLSWPVPELLGFAQPIDEGLISLVLASEQALCENQVYAHEAHSKRVDERLGKVTHSMIAAPLYVGGGGRGVFSCVRWGDAPESADGEGFSASDLNRVKQLSSVVERLLNYRILLDLLGARL